MMKNKRMKTERGMNPALAAMTAKRKEEMLISATAKANMLVTLMVLHDKFGFGKKRLERYMDEFKNQLEAYNSGYIERVQDFEDVLWEECGIRIEL